MVQFIELTYADGEKCFVGIDKITGLSHCENDVGHGKSKTEVYFGGNEDSFWAVKETVQEILQKIAEKQREAPPVRHVHEHNTIFSSSDSGENNQ